MVLRDQLFGWTAVVWLNFHEFIVVCYVQHFQVQARFSLFVGKPGYTQEYVHSQVQFVIVLFAGSEAGEMPDGDVLARVLCFLVLIFKDGCLEFVQLMVQVLGDVLVRFEKGNRHPFTSVMNNYQSFGPLDVLKVNFLQTRSRHLKIIKYYPDLIIIFCKNPTKCSSLLLQKPIFISAYF